MPLVVQLLFCLALILISAIADKPIGWVALTLSVIALLLVLFGGATIRLGT